MYWLNGNPFLCIYISSLFCVLLNIHQWFNVIWYHPSSPDDGSFELKRYNIDFV